MSFARVDRADFDRVVFGPSGHVTRYFERKGRQATTLAKTLCPIGDTGLLAQSIDFHADRDGLELFANTDYARYVLQGTEPHIIEATSGKMTFIDTRTGKRVFVETVNHPGNAANNFLQDAIDAVFP